MKVAELIQELQKLDPDTTVFVSNYGDDLGMYEYEPEHVGERTNIVGVKSGIIISMVKP